MSIPINWELIVAIIAAIFNLIQLLQNNKLKKENLILKSKIDNSVTKNQTSSGSGSNYMADKDITINNIGMNITDDIKVIFKKAYKKFYNNTQRMSLQSAYYKMIEVYFRMEIVSYYISIT